VRNEHRAAQSGSPVPISIGKGAQLNKATFLSPFSFYSKPQKWLHILTLTKKGEPFDSPFSNKMLVYFDLMIKN
jgi:hypothetical protein